MHTLENEILTVKVKEHGAELCSIVKGDTEYLWQADPAFWGRHSPVLSLLWEVYGTEDTMSQTRSSHSASTVLPVIWILKR